MRILCVGDSMTDRTNDPDDRPFSSDYTPPGPPLGYYPKHLKRILEADVHAFAAYSHNHDGLAMPTIAEWAVRATSLLKPDLVIVQGGGDDLDPSEPEATIEETFTHFQTCYEAVIAAGAKCLFLLIPEEHRGKDDPGGKKRRAVNCQLVGNFPDETLGYYYKLHDHPELLADGFHPNDEGCKLMAQLIADKIKEINP